MRILMLTNAMETGGAETHVLSLASALRGRGHQVTVASAGGRMTRELEDLGIRCVRLPLHSRNPFSWLLARRGLARLLAEQSWDIVHAHARLPAFLVAPLAAKRGICLVTTIHARFRAGWLYRRLSRWGYATVAVCEELLVHACRHFGLSPSDVTVIPNGVDTEHFCPAKTPRFGHHVLCMSRLDQDCAAAATLLCRIAPRLYKKFPDLAITIVGGGDAYEAVAKEAERAQCACGLSVRMTGRVSDPVRLLQSSDVFVGVSRSAMEAMACGASVVLGGDEGFFGLLDKEDLPLAEQDNFCARLCESALSEDKLYEALVSALSENKSQRQIRQRAMRQYAEERLSLSQMADATERLYERVMQTFVRGGGQILLCGYYGFGNMGDEALLQASLQRARERFGNVGVSVLMRDGRGRDGMSFGVRTVSRRRPLAVFFAVRRARVLVFGGGTLLQELTSRRSLWYYTALLGLAQRRKVLCELWGNGLGPIFSRRGERRVAACLRGCRYVGLRDDVSLSYAKGLMGDMAERAVYEKDLALGTGAADGAYMDFLWKSLGLRENGRYVLIAPKKSGRGIQGELERILFQERKEGKILLLAALYPKEDGRLCRKMARRYGGICLPRLSSQELVGVAARCERVYGMRLHALVFAASVGTPFCAIGTDPKLSAFERTWGKEK